MDSTPSFATRSAQCWPGRGLLKKSVVQHAPICAEETRARFLHVDVAHVHEQPLQSAITSGQGNIGMSMVQNQDWSGSGGQGNIEMGMVQNQDWSGSGGHGMHACSRQKKAYEYLR